MIDLGLGFGTIGEAAGTVMEVRVLRRKRHIA
jgi:hypothetical protein